MGISIFANNKDVWAANNIYTTSSNGNAVFRRDPYEVDANIQAGTSGVAASYTKRNIETGATYNTGVNVTQQGSANIGFTLFNNISQKELDQNNRNQAEREYLRHHPDRASVQAYTGGATVFNVESGGQNKYEERKDLMANAGAGYDKGEAGIGLFTSVKTISGDVYENQGWRVGGGLKAMLNGNGLQAMSELVYGMQWGKTSSRGMYGFEVGAKMNLTGPEFVASLLMTTSEGRKYTIPVGGFLSNLAYGNFVGAAYNIVQALSPEILPIPRHEAILPDSEPRIRTHMPLFENGTTKLNEHGIKMLADVVQNFKANPDMTMELGTYFDEKNFFGRVAQSLFNKGAAQKLSEERAAFIKEKLVEMGIPADKIQIGQSKVENDDKSLTIEDNYTNIRYKTNNNLALNDGARFNVERSSPAGEAKLLALQNDQIFKELTNGKSDVEKEIVANIMFDKTILSKPPVTIQECANEIKEKFYDKGILLSRALMTLNDKEAIANIKDREDFSKFVTDNKLSENEAKALSYHILARNDKDGMSLNQALQDYQSKFIGRDMTLTGLDNFRKEYMRTFDNDPTYKQMAEKLTGEERKLMQNIAFGNYLNNAEMKDPQQQISAFVKHAQENIYAKGQSFAQAYYAATEDKGTTYYKDISNKVTNDVRNNKDIQEFLRSDEFKQIAEQGRTSVSKERSAMLEILKERIAANPNLSTEQLFRDMKASVYDKGMTLGQYQVRDTEEKTRARVNQAVNETPVSTDTTQTSTNQVDEKQMVGHQFFDISKLEKELENQKLAQVSPQVIKHSF